MNSAASSFTNCVATSRISTTTTSQTPKATLFCRNNFSTRSGSLTTIRAMAESVDSETLIATTWVLCLLSIFTMSSIAPTLFGRKTENCFTSGPPIFEVVSGKSTGISVKWQPTHNRCRVPTRYLIVDLLLANLMCTGFVGQARVILRFNVAKPTFFQAVHFSAALYIRSPKMDEENELVALRRQKLDALRAKGVEPFGTGFEPSGSIAEVREKFQEEAALRAAGRITAHRDMGKSHFLDLRDATGRIQIYIHAKEIGADQVDLFRLLDIGDLIGVEGTCFLTKSGEPTLKVRTFQVLAKALRPLPEKWHGLQDVEARYRQRYLDLLTNERSRAVFEKRIAIVRETRRFFEERGFLEVETPILQTIAGGAAAEPFSTHHKALGIDLDRK